MTRAHLRERNFPAPSIMHFLRFSSGVKKRRSHGATSENLPSPHSHRRGEWRPAPFTFTEDTLWQSVLAIRYFVLPHGHCIDHSEERIGIARRRLRVPAMPERQSRAMAPGAGTVAKYRLPTAGYMFSDDVEIEMLEIAAPLE